MWSRLLNSDAGISLAEWIALDKEAAAELIDGIRFLRETNRKTKVAKLDKSGTTGALAEPTHVVDSDIAMVGNVDLDESEYDRGETDDDNSYFSSEPELDSTSSTASSEMLSVVSNVSMSEFLPQQEDLEFSDTESVHHYHYDLQKLKSGSPLRGTVYINTMPINCVFDTGASLSVISKSLCDKLALIPNGDKVQLVGFDNDAKAIPPADIVMNVPICVDLTRNKIRPEHFAVQQTKDNEHRLLLGMPWFQHYGINIDLEVGTVNVPTTLDMVVIQCTTSHPNRYRLRTGQTNISLNDRFAAYNGRGVQEINSVVLAQPHMTSLEDDLIPMGERTENADGESEENAVVEFTEHNISVGVKDELTRKDSKFVWQNAEEDAFQELKQCLISAPILTYPDPSKVQVLSVDASIVGLGAVLSQVDDFETMENEQVISYASKVVSGGAANLSIHHLESLAAVWGVNQYKHYLKGRKFILITDCSSLLFTFRHSKVTPKLNRWAACLLDYEFELRYRKGEQNTSDLLSRRIIELEKVDPTEIIRIG